MPSVAVSRSRSAASVSRQTKSGSATRLESLTLLQVSELPASIPTDVAAAVMNTTAFEVRAMCRRGVLDCYKVGEHGGGWRVVTVSLLRYCNMYDEVLKVRRALGRCLSGREGEIASYDAMRAHSEASGGLKDLAPGLSLRGGADHA